MAELKTGSVAMLSRDKGFGFIYCTQANGGRVEYFFHRSLMLEELEFQALNVGDRVAFNAVETVKGLRATDVRKVEGEGND